MDKSKISTREIKAEYETSCNDSEYNPPDDFDEDCNIDIIDSVKFARRYEE